MKYVHAPRQTTIIIIALAMFLVGLVGARVGFRVETIWLGVAGGLVLLSRRRLRPLMLLSLPLMGLLLGCWRGQLFMDDLQPLNDMVGEKVVLEAVATTDAVYDDKSQLSFQAESMNFIEPISGTTPGRIAVGGFGANAIYRGDVVQLEGKLRATRGSNQVAMSFADISLLHHNVNPLETIRLRFMAGMQTALPEPAASFGAGLLVGQRSTLPDQVSDDLSAVGLTHIVAVSGYNLTIIVMAVLALMKERSKYQIITITLVLIGLFVFLTGFSASIVRAALVSGLSLWAWYYGRTFRPLMLILLSAALTATYNPLYLWSDIGWYLSFLAFFGVLILAPLAHERLFGDRELGLVGAVVMETVCAMVMTIPIIMFVFQRLSLIALVSNVLIVPWVPLAMMFSVFGGLAGMLLPALAGWVAWPAKILLTYMLDMVHVFAQVPNAQIVRSMTVQALVWSYALLIGLCWLLWRRTDKKHGIISGVDINNSSPVQTWASRVSRKAEVKESEEIDQQYERTQ